MPAIWSKPLWNYELNFISWRRTAHLYRSLGCKMSKTGKWKELNLHSFNLHEMSPLHANENGENSLGITELNKKPTDNP